MKKTTRLLLIGIALMLLGLVFLDFSQEKILSASFFIVSAGFYIETARLMLLNIK